MCVGGQLPLTDIVSPFVFVCSGLGYQALRQQLEQGREWERRVHGDTQPPQNIPALNLVRCSMASLATLRGDLGHGNSAPLPNSSNTHVLGLEASLAPLAAAPTLNVRLRDRDAANQPLPWAANHNSLSLAVLPDPLSRAAATPSAVIVVVDDSPLKPVSKRDVVLLSEEYPPAIDAIFQQHYKPRAARTAVDTVNRF